MTPNRVLSSEELDREVAEALGKTTNDPLGHFSTDTSDFFKPSTRIDQAIELLEGLEWGLSRDIDNLLHQLPECGCYIRSGSKIVAHEHAATPAEAICRAWLAYKKGETP